MDKEALPVTRIERRRGGRPANQEPSAAVCTWLPASEHDKLIRLAKRHDVSVSQALRQIVILTLSR